MVQKSNKSVALLLCLLATSFALSFSLPSFAQHGSVSLLPKEEQSIQLRRLLGHVDAIGSDYGTSVRSGVVIDRAAYARVSSYTSGAQEAFTQIAGFLSPLTERKLQHDLASLQTLVLGKASPEVVQGLCENLRQGIIDGFDVTTAPAQTPDWSLGRQVYARECAACHGAQGRGDGVLTLKLNPPPRSLGDPALHLSPFKTYNVLLEGVEGTAMPAFLDKLSEQEIWSVAFYVSGMAQWPDNRDNDEDGTFAWGKVEPDVKAGLVRAGLSLGLLARSDNDELRGWVKAALPQKSALQVENVVTSLRLSAPYRESLARYSKPQIKGLTAIWLGAGFFFAIVFGFIAFGIVLARRAKRKQV